jgi:hypothetical protein
MDGRPKFLENPSKRLIGQFKFEEMDLLVEPTEI